MATSMYLRLSKTRVRTGLTNGVTYGLSIENVFNLENAYLDFKKAAGLIVLLAAYRRTENTIVDTDARSRMGLAFYFKCRYFP